MSIENPASLEGYPEESLVQEIAAAPERAEPTQAGGFEVNFSFESTLSTPEEAMDRVEKCLKELDWPEDEETAFLQAVEEAMTNAVVHNNLGIRHEDGEDHAAYVDKIHAAASGPDGKKKVEMSVDASTNRIEVKIKDEGSYVMEMDDRSDPTTGENLLLPRGRGQFLIFNGCDEVRSNPGELVLVKYRDGLAPSK